MKNIQTLGAVIGGIALLTQLAWAQETALPAPAAPPVARATPALPAEPQDLTLPDDPAEQPEQPERPEAVIRREDLKALRKNAEKVRDDVQRSVSDAMGAAHREVARAKADIARIQRVRSSDLQNSRTLVLPPTASGSGDLAEAHEDLAVMARIFGKAASKSGKNQREFAFRFGEGRDLDALYLGGYGALFFVSVDWPVGTEPKTEPKKAAKGDESDAVWEKERRKLRGGKDGKEDEDDDSDDDSTDSESGGYDAGKVRELTERLTAVYRHGANLRMVKDSEEIVVVVLGRGDSKGASGKGHAEFFGGGGGSMILNAFGVSEPGGTTLTFRARKSDILKLVASKAADTDFAAVVKVDGTQGVLTSGGKRIRF
jgi:hypothetical protein